MPKPAAIPKPQPRIARFERLAYGMFVHWGLYSQLGKGEWIQLLAGLEQKAYGKLKDTFTAADFDARALARLAREAGMRYVVLTTRHHEGFSLYDTRGLNDFDAPHSPAGRDLVAEFAEACRAEGLLPVFYHTTLDWYRKSHTCTPKEFRQYLRYLNDSVEILCTHYGKIGGLWFDGNWSRRELDWREDELYGLIRKLQPEAMIINNSGIGAEGKMGHPEIDSVTYEQSTPKAMDRRGMRKYVAGEMCQTFNAHWGIGANDYHYLSPGQVIESLCQSRKVGANYLLNVGPTATGGIPDYEAATLRRVGQWIANHGTMVYDGTPVDVRCEGRDFVLRSAGKLYYFVFDLAISGHANVTVGGRGGVGPRTISGQLGRIRSARWVDSGERLVVAQNPAAGIATLTCTGYPYGSNYVVRIAEITV